MTPRRKEVELVREKKTNGGKKNKWAHCEPPKCNFEHVLSGLLVKWGSKRGPPGCAHWTFFLPGLREAMDPPEKEVELAR